MRLVVKSGAATGTEVEIDRPMVAGRAPGSDIVIPDGGVSSRHASLRPVETGVEVTDLGSLNGTFVNGQRIDAPVVVPPGAELRFSMTVLEIVPSIRIARGPSVNAALPRPRLVVRTGPDRGREALLIEGRDLIVGRGTDSDLRLTDARVSDRNTRVRLGGGVIEVSDLVSANGTLVNGHSADGPVRATEGAEIQVGDTVISFVTQGGFDIERLPSPTIIGRAPGSGMSDSMIARQVDAAVAAKTSVMARRNTRILAAVGAVAVVGVSVGVWATLNSGGSTSTEDQTAAIVKAQTPATVRVDILNDKGVVISGGSGSIVDLENGYILTNNHVIADGRARIFNSITKTPIDAKLIGTAVCDDLAVLQVPELKKKFPDLKEVKFADVTKLQQGEAVVALGYPVSAEKFGTESLSATRGIISKTKTGNDGDPGSPHYPNVIQTDTAINHGNSGGPMFNLKGEQIGVNTFGLIDAQNTNYAISVGRVLEILPTLKSGKSPKWIGARFSAVRLSGGSTAIVIDTVTPGGAAEKTGLLPPAVTQDGQEPRTLITKIGGKDSKIVDDYCKLMPDSGPATITVSQVTGGKLGAPKDITIQVDAK